MRIQHQGIQSIITIYYWRGDPSAWLNSSQWLEGEGCLSSGDILFLSRFGFIVEDV